MSITSLSGGLVSTEPTRLWSLEDVIRFVAPDFAAAIATLAENVLLLRRAPEDMDWKEMRSRVEESLTVLARLPTAPGVVSQMNRLHALSAPDSNREVVAALTVQFYESLLAELQPKVFLLLAPDKATFYVEDSDAHAQQIAEAFGHADIALDFAAASRCFALDEWTACVFHMMRVLELGLRWIAGRLEVASQEEIEVAQWGKVIDLIQKRLRLMEKGNVPRVEPFPLYQEVAAQLGNANWAWRRHVAHARAFYDERQARDIMTFVIIAMEKMAVLRISEDDSAL